MNPPKVKASEIKATCKPRRPLVEKQCGDCPFRKGGGILKSEGAEREQDIAHYQRLAETGDFHCHDTVYVGKGTPHPVKLPETGWKVCKGAFHHRCETEVERIKQMFRDRGQLLEDE